MFLDPKVDLWPTKLSIKTTQMKIDAGRITAPKIHGFNGYEGNFS